MNLQDDTPNNKRRRRRQRQKARKRAKREQQNQIITMAALWLGVEPPVPGGPSHHQDRAYFLAAAKLIQRAPDASRDNVTLAAAMVSGRELSLQDATGWLRSTARSGNVATPSGKRVAALARALRAESPRMPEPELRRLARRIISGEVSRAAALRMLHAGNVATHRHDQGAA